MKTERIYNKHNVPTPLGDTKDYYETEDGRYGCLKCKATYKHKRALWRHSRYECGVQRQFECTNCLKKFKHRCHLKAHVTSKCCYRRNML
ncbi:zinc finger E-box-binding homeobox 2-like [Rhynchophorus ferrugineus]|uniref:zinc finger E-box-binding homeobox 2-like n=1 Tax=Rhynchophorus ferrugineus TaxID=354439 RepID=UPI003FCE585C